MYCGYLGYNSPITNFQFQYWDGTKWVDAISETANTQGLYRKSFTEVKTNKLRLNVNSTDGNIVRLYEIEVYGKEFNTLGTAENSLLKKQFTIYPNPTTNLLHISGENDIELLEIYDLNGRKLFVDKSVNSVDVSSLSSGIYFIKLNNKETLKFIKK